MPPATSAGEDSTGRLREPASDAAMDKLISDRRRTAATAQGGLGGFHVGQGETFARVKQRHPVCLGYRVGEAVPEIQCRGMHAFAEALMRL